MIKKIFYRLSALLLVLNILFISVPASALAVGETDAIPGDLDQSGSITSDDAVYLLFHTLFSDRYPVSQNVDYDQDGIVTSDDAVYLLFHTLFPQRYPLEGVMLTAGFSRVVANPDPGTGLGGYGNASSRVSGEVLDDICISCVAVSDGEEMLLLYSLDAVGVGKDSVWKPVTKLLNEELGIPKENILLNASHSHSAPAIDWKYATTTAYLESFYEKVLEAAEGAIADLAKATIKIGRTNTNNLGYVRRYLRYDGAWATASAPAGGTALPNNLDPAIYYHESDPDTEMQILYFDRETKKDILLCNWQCHVTAVGSENGTEVSSDFVGVFREKVEKELGVYCTYFQGAAGSIVPSGKLKGEVQNHKDYVKHGEDLAQTLLSAMDSLTSVKSGKIQISIRDYAGTVKEERVENYGETYNLRISAISIGSVAFATAPFEMDHRNGRYIKENSPYTMTFICAYSNGSHGYIPAESSYPNGGYEVNSSRFVAGTGEAVANELVSMLEKL